MKAGFVIALPQELKTLTRQRAKKGEIIKFSPQIEIILSGMGSLNASIAAEKLLNSGCDLLVSWGCCAGLQEKLDFGTIIVPEKIITQDDQSLTTSSFIRNKLQNELSQHVTVNPGAIAEAAKVLRKEEDKQNLRKKTDAVAADMESAAIARLADKHNINFIAIRAIADDANTLIPSCVEKSMNENGGINLFSLLINLAMHPGEIMQLLQLANAFSGARKALKQAAKQVSNL